VSERHEVVLASHGPDVDGKVHLVITPPAGPEPL
jgi:hypothetical protein